jgi:enoyl-CoA hydratase
VIEVSGADVNVGVVPENTVAIPRPYPVGVAQYGDAMSDVDTPVLVSRPRDGVVLVTLNRPHALNAMTADLVEGLHRTLDEIAIDSSARVVILTGAGRGFCAGLDISGYGTAPGAPQGGKPQAGLAVQRHIASLITHLRSIPQPVIAAVNGPAAGGGFALVLGSDIRLASPTARFNAAFIRIGLSACDIGTSWLLPRLVGVARAQEMMLTGRLVDAEEALRIGLVVDLAEDVVAAAFAKADLVMENAAFGVALTKEGMWAALEIPALATAIEYENRQQIMATFSEDHREAMAAFLERRPPRFENR